MCGVFCNLVQGFSTEITEKLIPNTWGIDNIVQCQMADGW